LRNSSPTDHQIKSQAGNGIVMNVKTVGEIQNWKFCYEEMYAFVHKGIPYIATEFGYYKFKKASADWIFTGRMWEVASQGAMLLGGLVGFAGVATVAENTTTTYEICLDPISGRFIKLREAMKR
jgi:hypothetical protein